MTKLRLFLILSVVLNVFLIGALSGGAAWLNFGRRMIIPAGSLRVAGAELPAKEQRAFRAALKQARASVADRIAASRQAKAEVASLLSQPVLDKPALLAALAQVRAADIAVRTAIESQAVDFAATLPAEDRARLADAVSDRLERASENRP